MSYTDFFIRAIKIKNVKRTGWLYKNVSNPESVADHSFGTAILALTIDLPKDISREKLVSMALIHDVGEGIIGDLVWENGKISHREKQEKKHKQEEVALKNILEGTNKELLRIGLEFLNQNSKEAEFLKELDKLEMVFQALEYEKYVNPSTLDEFWENAEKYIKSREVKRIYLEVKKLRSL